MLISEIMFNPVGGGADYVELYNHSNVAVPLADIRLAQWKGDSIAKLHAITDHYEVAPQQYVVLTTDVAFVRSHYTVKHPNHLIEVSTMPAYNNTNGTVIVAHADGTVIDRFDYTEKMHNPLLHDVEGVALERRSFDIGTQMANNWFSAATTVGYGTPTYTNSQSNEFLFLNNDFVIEPTLFSPDGDGYNDLIDITYQLVDGTLSAIITIFDAAGRPLRHLANGTTLGTHGIITWDGTRDDGSRCQPGSYALLIDIYNTQGRHQRLKRAISIVL